MKKLLIFGLSILPFLFSLLPCCFAQTTYNLQIIFKTGAPEDSISSFGMAIGGVGDVNGDGYDDVTVLGHRVKAQQDIATKVYLYYGGLGGIDSIPDLILYDSAQPGAGGRWIAEGDLNGDGFSDVVVSGRATIPNILIYYGSNPMDSLPDDSLPRISLALACGDVNA
ncbi:MAG: FG-GAP-like repeat-containing protein [Candidatus Edwardsbacteria bacterium]